LPSNSTILKYLSDKPKTSDSLKVTEDIIKMFYEKETPEWAEYLETFDLPHEYEITLMCFVNTGIALMFPWPLAYIITYVFSSITLPKRSRFNFVMTRYMPEL
jgi:hypothetical protein